MTTLAKCIGPDASDARTIQRLAERCLRERRAALVRLDLIEDERLRLEIEAEAERQLGLGGGSGMNAGARANFSIQHSR